jgi:hypothetical protein
MTSSAIVVTTITCIIIATLGVVLVADTMRSSFSYRLSSAIVVTTIIRIIIATLGVVLVARSCFFCRLLTRDFLEVRPSRIVITMTW